MQEIEVGVQRLFKQFGLFSVIVFFLPLVLLGGSFSDFKRTQVGSFETFQDQNDKKFNTYLKEQWREYEAYTTPAFFQKPKPKSINSLQEQSSKIAGPIIDISLPTLEVPKKSDVKDQSTKKDIQFDFFGTTLGFNVDAKIKGVLFYPKNQNGIITFFGVMASSDFGQIVHDLKSVSTQLELNDWGVYQLVETLSKNIYTQPDEQKLFRWFILSKLGYDVKIALVKHHVVLLNNSLQTIYATPRYKINGNYYYAIDYQNSGGSLGRLYTYDKTYPEATKKLDFQLSQIPKLTQDLQLKKLKFSLMDGNYEIDVKINKNLIEFMKTYPQVEYDVYFNAAFDKYVYEQVTTGLREYINGKKAAYGLNFILHFVQKSFLYQRDDEQFGKDKVMFAEETLFYDHSDCEDRAILFAKLVRKIFNYGVVGVKYKNHMSTALYVPLTGDSVKIGSRKYVIADPTYINANIGMNMPKYKNIQPEAFVKLQ